MAEAGQGWPGMAEGGWGRPRVAGDGRGWLEMAGRGMEWPRLDGGPNGFYARDLKRGALALRDFYDFMSVLH